MIKYTKKQQLQIEAQNKKIATKLVGVIVAFAAMYLFATNVISAREFGISCLAAVILLKL